MGRSDPPESHSPAAPLDPDDEALLALIDDLADLAVDLVLEGKLDCPPPKEE
jgi:hypothetical protein